jgi:hypothetical protein
MAMEAWKHLRAIILLPGMVKRKKRGWPGTTQTDQPF